MAGTPHDLAQVLALMASTFPGVETENPDRLSEAVYAPDVTLSVSYRFLNGRSCVYVVREQ